MKNKKLVLIALKQNGQSIAFASPELQRDDEIIKLYIIEKMIEPTAPSIVLFGDNDSYSLFLPKLFQTK